MTQTLPAQGEIAALLPCYTEKGDCTTILTRNGQTILLTIRLRTVLNRLARSLATDLTVLKRHCAANTRRTILQPLPLSPALLLVPVKVRTPRIAGDTCTGYINYHVIADVAPTPGKASHSVITLASGQLVPVLWTTSTVNHYLQLARLAAYTAPGTTGSLLRETSGMAEPELLRIAHKLVEVFQGILLLRQN